MWFGYYASNWVVVGINGAYSLPSGCTRGCVDLISPVWSMVYQLFGIFFGGMIGYCYSFVFILAIQTFISTYLIIRGSTFWYNFGYPSEVVLLNAASVQMNGMLKLGYAFYAYLLVILIMWIVTFRRAVREAFKDGGRSYIGDDD